MSKFSGLTEKIKKHKKLTIVGVVVLALAVGGVAVAGNANKRREQMLAAMNQVQTFRVERRTLVSSVSATGTLASVDSKEVSVNLSGVEIENVSVQIGDVVEAGQVLCEFNSEDIEENLADAKTSLSVATQKTQMELTTAERNLADAKEDYDTDLKRGNTDLDAAYNDYVVALEDVEEAEDAWDEAKEYAIDIKAEYELSRKLAEEKKAALDAAGASSTYKQKFDNIKKELSLESGKLDKISLENGEDFFGLVNNTGNTNSAEVSSITDDTNTTDVSRTADDTSSTDASSIADDTGSADASSTADNTGSTDVSSTADNTSSTDDSGNTNSIQDPNDWGKIEELNSLRNSYNASLQLEAEYASLQQEVSSWQTKYNTAKSSESAAENAYEQAVSASEAQLSAYQKQQRTLEDTTKSAENAVITKTESLTTTRLNALSSGNSEEAKVEEYQQQLDDCIVEAPISGVISAVNIEAGDTYNGSAIVTIDDISAFEVTAEIDEYDIGKIEKGQKVVIKTNATGEEELEGTVQIVSPKASTGGNEVTYTVIISVDTPNEMLRMDMTAKLSIILESKENVLTVPYEAVQEDESGNYYVEVVDNVSESTPTSGNDDTKGNTGTENEQMPEGVNSGNVPQMPTGAESEDMPQGMEGMNAGNSQRMPGGNSAENTDVNTRRIYVEKGIESDYYIEIVSSEITEGMEVVVPKTDDENGGNIQMMMMRQGPMGGF